MAEEVVVPLGGVVDALVHHRPRQRVAVLGVLVAVSGEKPDNGLINYFIKLKNILHFMLGEKHRSLLPGVVTLLHHDVGDVRPVGAGHGLARPPDGRQLPRHHGLELALAHPVPEHDQLAGKNICQLRKNIW